VLTRGKNKQMAGNNNNEDQDEAGKIFIGGIHRSTTQDGLKHYFEKFGEVTICKLMIDKETGNSRGFGFVTYADPACIGQVMASKPHTLDGKIIDPKPCSPKHVLQQKKLGAQFPKTHKVFLGGISMEATEEDVKAHFIKYGNVVEVNFVVDKTDSTRPHKGFGFVTFEEESSVDQAVAKHYHIIKDKRTEAKRAETKDKTNGSNMVMGMNMTPNMMGLVTGSGQQGQQQQGWMNGAQNFGMNNMNQMSMMAQMMSNPAMMQQMQQMMAQSQNQMYQGYGGYGMPQQPMNQPMGGGPNMAGAGGGPNNMGGGQMMNPGMGGAAAGGPNNNYQQSNSGYGPIRQGS